VIWIPQPIQDMVWESNQRVQHDRLLYSHHKQARSMCQSLSVDTTRLPPILQTFPRGRLSIVYFLPIQTASGLTVLHSF